MAVLVRSMRYCLTSEGEQAVVTAVISLLALNVFVDGTIAVQVSDLCICRLPRRLTCYPLVYLIKPGACCEC